MPWEERYAGLLQTSLQGREYLLLSRRLQHESANALCGLSDDNQRSMITLVAPGCIVGIAGSTAVIRTNSLSSSFDSRARVYGFSSARESVHGEL